jgi:hypothetical protein
LAIIPACFVSGFVCSLWKLLKADNSQIAQVCVPLLIHCLTQPSGSDVFWKLVQTDFTSEDWKIRFSAGELFLGVDLAQKLLYCAKLESSLSV